MYFLENEGLVQQEQLLRNCQVEVADPASSFSLKLTHYPAHHGPALPCFFENCDLHSG